jgi:hypothetical protein
MESEYALNQYYKELGIKKAHATQDELKSILTILLKNLNAIESRQDADFNTTIRLYEVEDIAVKVKRIANLLEL